MAHHVRNLDEMTEDDISERFEKYVKKFNKGKLPEEYLTLPPPVKVYPLIPTSGDVSILLFYAYVPKGLMTRGIPNINIQVNVVVFSV